MSNWVRIDYGRYTNTTAAPANGRLWPGETVDAWFLRVPVVIPVSHDELCDLMTEELPPEFAYSLTLRSDGIEVWTDGGSRQVAMDALNRAMQRAEVIVTARRVAWALLHSGGGDEAANRVKGVGL